MTEAISTGPAGKAASAAAFNEWIRVPDGVLRKWQKLVDAMAEVVGVPAGLIMRVTGEDIRVLVASQTTDNPYHPGDSEHFSGSGLYCETVINSGEPLLIPDALSDEQWRNNPDIKLNMISYLGFPIRWPDRKPFGTICVLDRRNNAFSEAYKRLIVQFKEVIESHLEIIYSDASIALGFAAARDRAQEAQRFSEEHFHLLVEHAGDSFYLHDDHGRILDINEQACRSTGYSRQELMRMAVADLSLEDDRPRQQLWRRMQPEEAVTVVASHRRKDGSVFPVEARVTCYIHHGRKLFLGLVRDISERVEAERTIRQLNAELEQRVIERTALWKKSATLLQAVIDGTTDAVFVKDLQGRYLLFNEAAAQFVDRPAAEVLGRDDTAIFDAETARKLIETDRRVMREGGSSVHEERLTTAAGAARTYRATKGPYLDEQGQVIGLIGISHDITELKDAAEHIRVLGERMQLGMKAGGVGIWELDPHNGLLVWDEAMYALYGLEPGSYDGSLEQWLRLLHPEDVGATESRWQAMLTSGADCESTFRIFLPSGEMRHIRTRARVFLDGGGKPQRLLGINWDVTELHHTAAQLERSNQALIRAERLARIGHWSLDLVEDRFTWSDMIYEMLGWERRPGQVIRFEDLRHVYTPDSLAISAAVVQECLATGKPGTADLEAVHANGEHFFINAKAEVQRDAEGRIVALFGTVLDITERKRAEAAMGEAKERFDLVVRGARSAIWDLNIASGEAYWSERFRELVGLGPEIPATIDNHRRLVLGMIHPLDRERVIRALLQHARQRTPYREEYRLLRPDGSMVWVEGTAQMQWAADGSAVRMAGAMTDIGARKQAERALQESQARWQFALDGAGDGIWDWDVRNETVFFSRQWKAMLGYADDEVGNTLADWADRVHPDDLPRCWTAIERHIWTHTPDFVLEHRMLAKDGSWRWILDRGRVIERAEDGGPLRLIGTHTDITARKTMEENLAARERWLSEMVENLPTAAVFVTGEQIRVNRAVEMLTGFSRQELPDRETWFRATGGKFYQARLRSYRQAREAGFPHAMEVQLRRKDGVLRQAEVIAAIVGEHEIWLLRDVTESRQAEDRILRLNERFRLAATASGSGIWEMDAQGRVVWDDQAAALYGLEPGIRRGELETFRSRLHPDDLPATMIKFVEAVRGNSLMQCEFRVRRGPGEWRWIQMHAQLIRDPAGLPLRMVATHRDVTAEREAAEALRQAKEAAESAQRAKSEFLAMMSHEIRTPMNAVVGMTRLALQTGLDQRQRGYLEKIAASSATLLGIINDVLDFSRIEAGKLELAEAEFRLVSVFESVAAVTAVKAEEKGLQIVYDVAADMPEVLVGDAMRLGQILINLVSNAVKFTERGGIVVSASIASGAAQDGLVLRFAVSDTGIGIEPEQMPRLFNAFSQGDRYTGRHYGGTGLGLAICRQLVERMGGSIGVRSEPGRGSMFEFRVQMRAAAAPPAAADRLRGSAQLPRGGPPARLAGRRVLVVDDNALNREVVAEFLQAAGVQVDTAADGVEALRHLESAACDAVLMDVQMPRMDGLEAIRRIRAEARWAGLPVIALTAHAQPADRAASLAAGADEHLIKPIDEQLLYEALQRLLPATGAAPAQAPAPAGAALPDTLPGIDIGRALAGLGGRPERLPRLFRAFARDFAAAPQRAEAELRDGRHQALAALAHTARSAAAYLGAVSLSDAAARLEESASRGDVDTMPQSASLFCSELRMVLSGLDTWLSQQARAPAVAEPAAADAPALAGLIERAGALVAQGDHAALVLLDRIVAGCGLAQRPLAETARSAFEALELDAAGAALRQLHAHFARTRPGT